MNRTKPPLKNKKFTNKMQANILLVFCVILVATLVLCVRIIMIGAYDGERYKKKVLEQQSYVSAEIPYQRGTIYDRNGLVLARSEKTYTVILDPRVMMTYDIYVTETKKALETVFGYSKESIQEILDKNPTSQYYIMEKQVSISKVQAFEAIQKDNSKVKGVWFEENFIRNYPYKSLASHILGFTASGNQGIWGVEQYYNDDLNGTNGRVYGYYDSELNLQRTVKNAENGHSLNLTIDANLQTIVQRYITDYQTDVGCRNIGIVIMNPNNGEILAMASNQEYDLNQPRNLDEWYTKEEQEAMTEEEQYEALNRIWRNFCISDTYEPGSTYKPFTIAAALEEAAIHYQDTFTCKGYETKGGWDIYCAMRDGHGLLSLTEAIMKSCNCALMNIVEKEGRTIYHNYQKRYGFGDITGIDLPGETKGIIMPEEKLNVTELATASFGQSFNVSMIQMAAAFSSLVNGGYYYQPHLVSSIIKADGVIERENAPLLVRNTISEATSEFLRDALYQTVEAGTGVNAKVEGYLIGGKTGTAQKLPREDKKYVVSFISCVPVEHPELLSYIVIDEPQDEKYFASSYYATTMTSKMMEEMLPFLGIYPDGEINYHIQFPQETTSEGDEVNTDPIPPEAEESE